MTCKSVFCDECGKKIDLSHVVIRETVVDVFDNFGNANQVILTYFACDHCDKIYKVMLTDDACVLLKRELRVLESRMRKLRNCSANEGVMTMLFETYTRKKARLSKRIDRLSEKYPGTFTCGVSEENQQEKIIIYQP